MPRTGWTVRDGADAVGRSARGARRPVPHAAGPPSRPSDASRALRTSKSGDPRPFSRPAPAHPAPRRAQHPLRHRATLHTAGRHASPARVSGSPGRCNGVRAGGLARTHRTVAPPNSHGGAYVSGRTHRAIGGSIREETIWAVSTDFMGRWTAKRPNRASRTRPVPGSRAASPADATTLRARTTPLAGMPGGRCASARPRRGAPAAKRPAWMRGNDVAVAVQRRVAGLCHLGGSVYAPGGVCPAGFVAIRGGRARVVSTDFIGSDTAKLTKTRGAPPSRAREPRHSAGTLAGTPSTCSAASEVRTAGISASSRRTMLDGRLRLPTADRVRERERRTVSSGKLKGGIYGPASAVLASYSAIRGEKENGQSRPISQTLTRNANTCVPPSSRNVQPRHSAGTFTRAASTVSAAYDVHRARISTTSRWTVLGRRLVLATQERVRERERRPVGSRKRNGGVYGSWRTRPAASGAVRDENAKPVGRGRQRALAGTLTGVVCAISSVYEVHRAPIAATSRRTAPNAGDTNRHRERGRRAVGSCKLNSRVHGAGSAPLPRSAPSAKKMQNRSAEAGHAHSRVLPPSRVVQPCRLAGAPVDIFATNAVAYERARRRYIAAGRFGAGPGDGGAHASDSTRTRMRQNAQDSECAHEARGGGAQAVGS
ncbi:hypothetical protein VTO73DRAFT_3915 [Trametes versicolor]